MEIAIKGTAEEIAALVLAVQERRDGDLPDKVMNQIAEQLSSQLASARIPG
ncbi:MAG: hypothetical protein NC489_39120 [Ruminococcus flavefaciens]|nr:hypothetical protein [Ruminococcus flavefaciens]